MKEGTVYAITTIAIAAVLISMMIFAPEPDPREQAMRDCVGLASPDSHKLECAKVIYGEDK